MNNQSTVARVIISYKLSDCKEENAHKTFKGVLKNTYSYQESFVDKYQGGVAINLPESTLVKVDISCSQAIKEARAVANTLGCTLIAIVTVIDRTGTHNNAYSYAENHLPIIVDSHLRQGVILHYDIDSDDEKKSLSGRVKEYMMENKNYQKRFYHVDDWVILPESSLCRGNISSETAIQDLIDCANRLGVKLSEISRISLVA